MSTDDVIVPLNLTQELLDAGIRKDCVNCPLAMAFEVACPGAYGIGVMPSFVAFIAGRECHRIDLPHDARNVIDAFDVGFKVDPRVIPVAIPRSIASIPGFLADETLLSPRATEPMPL